jgi:phage terminase small subunit
MARSISEPASVVAEPILQVIEGGKAAEKLTAKQQGFVNSILAGEDQVTAYEQNYETDGMARKTMYEAASRLFANSKVSAKIKRGRHRLEEAELHSALALRQHIEKRLFNLTENADTDANRLKALDLLGRTEKVGMFVERRAEAVENLSAEEIRGRLEEKLGQLFGGPA